MKTAPTLGILVFFFIVAPIRAARISGAASNGPSQLSAQAVARIRTKEAALKDALSQMREAIDRYYADTKRYPEKLDSLTAAKYLRTVPTDPFTNSSGSWRVIRARTDQKVRTTAPGIQDVKSRSKATALDGTKYSDW